MAPPQARPTELRLPFNESMRHAEVGGVGWGVWGAGTAASTPYDPATNIMCISDIIFVGSGGQLRHTTQTY